MRDSIRQHWPLLAAAIAIWLLSLSLSGDVFAAEEMPVYEVTPCCQLCPAASDPASYAGGYLDSFRFVVQGKDGWLFRSEDDLMTRFGLDPISLNYLARLREVLAARGVTLVMLPLPPRGLMEWHQLDAAALERYPLDQARFNYRAMLDSLRHIGIAVPPLEELLLEKHDAHFYFSRDHHWRPEGAQRTAELVARSLTELPAFADIPTREFTTRGDGILRKGGTLTGAVRRLCGFGYTEEIARRFVTSTEGSGADDLLGDSAAPKIVLAGTSNSDAAYNFAGYLSEYSGADVLNVSVAGGDVEGALLEYLGSPEFQESPPAILIWEMPGYSNIGDDRVYRQVIPMVHDGCADATAELQGQTALSHTPSEVLFNGDGQVLPLTGSEHLLDVTVSDASMRDLKFTVWYTNGKKDSFTISQPEHADTGGRFVAELRDDDAFRDATFLSMDVASKEPLADETTATAKLCRRRN